jgi:hypothetical protein
MFLFTTYSDPNTCSNILLISLSQSSHIKLSIVGCDLFTKGGDVLLCNYQGSLKWYNSPGTVILLHNSFTNN